MSFTRTPSMEEDVYRSTTWSVEKIEYVYLHLKEAIITFTGEGKENSSKSQLLTFVVFSLVTNLTIKLDSQLRSSRTHRNQL